MLLIKNKKAIRNYEILEKYEAGVVLKGYEVKALREGNGSFEGSYVKIEGKDIILVNVHIGKYSKQSQDIDKLDPKRNRKLLLHKREISKISAALNEKGKTAIPLAFILRNNMVKLEFAIVKGLKKYEKKHVEKEKQIEKDLKKYTAQVRKGTWDL